MIAVLGAGSWGTALAVMLGRQNHAVKLWGRDPHHITRLQMECANARYLPGVELPASVTPYSDLQETQSAQIVILAVPAGAVGPLLDTLPPMAPDTIWTLAAKGLEPTRGILLTELLSEIRPETQAQTVALSGPNLAVELVKHVPTATVAASRNPEAAARIQELFMSPTLRVYTNPDVIGVELGGALKNVYAIGAGVSDGLGYGDNTKAVLLTRGLAEMMRFGVAMGAQPQTFTGLTGIGDLIATASSRLSRNYRFGRLLAEGKSAQEAMTALDQVVEGYPTALIAAERARALGVETPILNTLSDLMQNRASLTHSLQSLMTRPPRGEHEFTF